MQVSIIAENYKCEVQSGNDADDISSHTEKSSALEAGFSEALKETNKCIVDAFNRIGSWNSDHTFSDKSLGNITMWKTLFESYAANLQLDVIWDAVVKAINCAVSYIIVLFAEEDF